ncbi:pseudouridine synthase, partial [Acidocella sp.]|uniref:pseudouridine synthase n=1 Tax=Acidocella sp. TaxID=50710 RepID=UPI0025BEC0FC
MTPPGVLYRDRRFIIVDKPAGLPVHAGRAGGPSVEDFFPQWRLGRDGPWLAHRLDQDTAGCLVVALKKSALLAAQACFAGGGAQKTYWAVVRGVPEVMEGVVELPLAKV